MTPWWSDPSRPEPKEDRVNFVVGRKLANEELLPTNLTQVADTKGAIHLKWIRALSHSYKAKWLNEAAGRYGWF